MKDDLPWFSHDNDARNHPKMKALITQYGAAGYGWFWMLNEVIAESPGAALDISRRVNRLALARELGMTGEKLDEFIAFLSDPDIDLITLSGGILTTDRIRENHDRVAKKRQTDRKNYRKQNSDSGNADSDSGKFRQRKRNSDSGNRIPLSETPIPTTETPIPTVENIHSRVEKRSTKSSGGRSEYSDPGKKKIPPPEAPPVGHALPPPDLLKKIQVLSLRIGFAIDDNLASRLAGSLNPAWFEEPYSYPEFVDWFVREKYPDKPRNVRRDIYRKALWAFDDIRQEYPPWRDGLLRRDAEKPPETCPDCGVRLKSGACPACGGFYESGSSGPVFVKKQSLDFSGTFRVAVRSRAQGPPDNPVF
ncbi:MAG: DUF4373 domain-containing protein [Treponema sp.]|jgi:hypothetical protein|nr:DUF4373 domain-containing protein [Treponema sp.]